MSLSEVTVGVSASDTMADGMNRPAHSAQRIAVVVPCYNEALSIEQVVRDFKAALPAATIYVYDNNSKDETANVARAAGATVVYEGRQGKGYVVRRMLSDIDADVYVLVDGDATYDAPSAPRMVSELVAGNFDMAVGVRISQHQDAYRRGHGFGNKMLTGFVAAAFGADLKDMLSGYRVFSRRFVKSFPVLSRGFEIETELTVHAIELGLPIVEIDTPYFARPEGSTSKLNTWRDGFRILGTIFRLYRSERPLSFFSILGVMFAILSLVLATPLLITFVETGLVPRLPTAILSTGLMLLACLSGVSGLILDTVARSRREMKLLAYLAQKAPLRG